MGLYQRLKENYSNQFSIFQVISLLQVDATEVRIIRNALKQLHQQGLIKRIGKNMYEIIK